MNKTSLNKKPNDSNFLFGNEGYKSLNEFIINKNYSKVFVLVDNNTNKNCFSHFQNQISSNIKLNKLLIKPGEVNKNISSCLKIWGELSNLSCDRNSVLINLGGGVITDIGGFIASTFKRGIDFINIPTSLLSMVDASIGGKNGIDLGVLKNQIGVFKNPNLILIDELYLDSLPLNEFKSGFSEMLKHALISDINYWEKLKYFDFYKKKEILTLIKKSIEIKKDIVLKDPLERNLRKTLNFGHTIGHAIESYFMESSKNEILLHGEAIGIGMIIESYLSHKYCNLNMTEVDDIKKVFNKIFQKVNFNNSIIESIYDLLIYDKKNSYGKINFVLIKRIGEPAIDLEVSKKAIIEGFDFYMEK